MRTHVLEEVIAEIESLSIDEETKARCLSAVCAVGRRNGVKSVAVRERLAFTVNLLAKGMSRSEVRKRLVSVHEISDRQAIRTIGEILNSRQTRATNGGH